MPPSQLRSKPIGYEPPSRSVWANPFQWTAETEYGRQNLAMNEVIYTDRLDYLHHLIADLMCTQKRHWRRINNCKATTVCRQDGGKFIATAVLRAIETHFPELKPSSFFDSDPAKLPMDFPDHKAIDVKDVQGSFSAHRR